MSRILYQLMHLSLPLSFDSARIRVLTSSNGVYMLSRCFLCAIERISLSYYMLRAIFPITICNRTCWVKISSLKYSFLSFKIWIHSSGCVFQQSASIFHPYHDTLDNKLSIRINWGSYIHWCNQKATKHYCFFSSIVRIVIFRSHIALLACLLESVSSNRVQIPKKSHAEWILLWMAYFEVCSWS